MPSVTIALRQLGMAITALGALILLPGFADLGQAKPAVMACGLFVWACTLASPSRLSFQVFLTLIALLFTLVWRGHHPQSVWSACLTLGCTFAFYLGWAKAGIPRIWLQIVIWIAILGSLADLLALTPWLAAHDAMASFFQNRHALGGALIAALFAHLLWVEKATFSPIRWASAFGVIVALLLCDSRSAQGAFFLVFFPLLFLSVRLDFKEPHPERLLWVAGITLCAGAVWLNLPDRQLHAVARVFTEDPLATLQGREAAWQIFRKSPWLGQGSGSVAAIASHPLQVLAENGLLGLALELAILALALLGLFREALLKGRAEARYAGFALLALYLHGLFSPALEAAPLRILLFGLMGYGAALWPGKNLGTERTRSLYTWVMRAMGGVTVAYFLTLGFWQWRANQVYQQALLHSDNPHAFTDLITETLRRDPLHVEANYAYAQVLATFHRKVEAMTRLDLVARYAPDSLRQDLTRASILVSLGESETAVQMLKPWLHRPFPSLPALELTAKIQAFSLNCQALEILQADSLPWLAAYPKPDARVFTTEALQQEFLTGEDVNFLQRWFGGKALRQRFVARRLNTYQEAMLAHERVKTTLRLGCGVNDKEEFSRPGRHWRRQG